ncbi:MAG: hypothetical protein AABW67_03670 [Nanoarchaeota archaeon]
MIFKRGFRHILDYGHYNTMQKRVGLALLILLISLVIFSGYFLFIYAKPVLNAEGFGNAMVNCNHVSWIKEDAQASWLYTIKGNARGDACNIEVKLLKMKEGTLDSEKLQGMKMLCVQGKGDTQFPEKDISKCSGELKEQLQELIIQRMHSYILENFGEIKAEFKGA